MKISAMQNAAEKLGIGYVDITLNQGTAPKTWLSPESGYPVNVEYAVLSLFRMEGWRGYSGEGGLILNLIKAMSFEEFPIRHRSTYIEALYAQNVAFDEDRYPTNFLLNNVKSATILTIEKNYKLMTCSGILIEKYNGYTCISSESILDEFPGLELWMFTELYSLAGNELMHNIASIFAKNPYEYRKGWPDITMWKNGELRFVEVKTPGDRIRSSQRTIVNEFAKPLRLNFYIAGVNNE